MSIGDVGKGADRVIIGKDEDDPQGADAGVPADSVGQKVSNVPRQAVIWFAVHMEKTLRKNDHKPPWDKEDTRLFFAQLLKELSELLIANTRDDVIDECTDIANYAMMIAHNMAGNPGGCNREELKP